MIRIRLALATALLMISGPTLAGVVLVSSIGTYGSVSYCPSQFETVYVESIGDGECEWMTETSSERSCN